MSKLSGVIADSLIDKINERFPLEIHYSDFKNTDYTKKFLLIKKTSDYYREASKVIKDMTEFIIMHQGERPFSYNNVTLYSPHNALNVFNIFNDELFCFDLVRQACNHWLNNNDAYDEYTYINSKINELGLNESIETLKNEIKLLKSLRIAT